MADFLSNDISDAKKRVEEMRKKSKSYVEETPIQNNIKNENISGGMFDFLGPLLSSHNVDSSSWLIIAIIFILSREGGNNKLILALLYILL